MLVGTIAGWLTGMLVSGGGFGLVGNIAVGILVAAIASYLLPKLGISFRGGKPLINQIVSALINAVILLLVVGIGRR